MIRSLSLMSLVLAWVLGFLWLILTPAPGWYDYHMSFNERWYSDVLAGIQDDRVLPPGLVWIGGLLPFSPVVSLRLVSLAATLGLGALINRFWGWRHALVFFSSPFVLVWGVRAQLDALMCFLCLGGLLMTWTRPFLAGWLVGLSAFVKPVGVLSVFTFQRWDYYAGFGLGLVPFLAWLASVGPSALEFHAGSSSPFGNWMLNILWLFLGLGVWCLRVRHFPFIGPLMMFLVFAFIKAPLFHQYYLLPVVVLLGFGVDVRGWGFWVLVGLNSILAGLMLILLQLPNS